MADTALGFGDMPPEFQRVLRLAEERNDIAVTPLDRLVGGWSGASIHLVSVQAHGSRPPEHCVLKLDRTRPSARSGEADRHAAALASAPAAFARHHMADLVFDPVEQDGAVAIFYRIAGQSLQRYRPIGSFPRQSQLSAILAAMSSDLLDEWNPDPEFRQVAPPDLVRTWLSFRLKPDGHLDAFLRTVCQVDPAVPGFLVGGTVMRNALAYARDPERWIASRPIDAMFGSQHGDLNTSNVLLQLDGATETVAGYYVIDFAAFQPGMPLLYDQRYVEMSYLLLALARVPTASATTFLARLAEADAPDPHRAPVETAGTAAVVAAARQAFDRWVGERHPSLRDDLWAQYWLAGVSAGLAYCHKPGLGEDQRLAGLLYACANLERYAAAFPLPAPAEVTALRDAGGSPAPAVRGSADGAAGSGSALPASVTPFVGRIAELARGVQLLRTEEVRLLTLVGPGGIGKTRLSLELARDVEADFADGVVLVDLAPARDAEQVLPVIARAIALRATGDRPLRDAVTGHLATRRVLLVLDNFEQVLSAAPVVADLLVACSRLTVLVTSRGALHLRGEHLLPVPVLLLPEPVVGPPDLAALGESDAVSLFVERARAVDPDFRLTEGNAAAVAGICRRLDGLPLAIELAAARIALLPPPTLLERLSRPLQVLRGGARDLPERQQTLRDTIDWSYGLLSADEQRLFAVLSVFSGCTLEAAESVASSAGVAAGLDPLDGITSLLDKSLLRPVASSARPRFGMLQTIRDFAAERLDGDARGAEAAREAHAIFFAAFVRDRAQRLGAPDRRAVLRELEAEVDNLRTAWQHWVEAGDLEHLQAMTQGIWALNDARGWYHATAALTTDLLGVLAAAPPSAERAQEEILLQMSLAHALLATNGYTPEVEAAYTRAIEVGEAYGHPSELTPVLRALSSLYALVAQFEKGAAVGEQMLRLAEEHDDPVLRVEGHFVVGSCMLGTDPTACVAHLDQALAEYDPERSISGRYRMGNDTGVPICTTSALVLWMLGSHRRSRERADQALALAQRLDHPYSGAYACFHTGLLALWRGEAESAERLAVDGLRIAEAQGFEIWRALALCLRGAALAELGRTDEGVDLIEQGVGRYQRLHTPPVFWPLLLFIRARVAERANRPEQAMALLDEALSIVEPGAADPMAAEMCRLKGELLLALGVARRVEAERWFERALEVARGRGTRTLELRAAMSLSRLWHDQGRTEEARHLLADAVARQPEELDTAEAKATSVLLAS